MSPRPAPAPSALLDISPPLSSRIAVWPGDVPFRRDVVTSRGVMVSSLSTTLHVGSHADAPRHVDPSLAAIDSVPLDVFFGPCQVIEARASRGGRVRPEDLAGEISAPRVLVKTGTFPDPERWDDGFAGVSIELVAAAVEAGVLLLGIDTPSVDPFGDDDLPAHRALARHGLIGLEGLVLAHVAPGRYTLVALPLRLTGADASPVRAALAPAREP